MPEFKKSTRKNKKYMVITPKGRLIHFGDTRYQHYFDRTPLKLYSHLNHNNKKRRDLYRKRHSKIKLKSGMQAYQDKERPSYYAWHYLW